MGGPLADEKPILFPDQGGYHVHRLFLSEHRSGAGEDGDLSLGGEQGSGASGFSVNVHIPCPFGKIHGQGAVVGVENGKNAVIPILHPVAHRFGAAGLHREDTGENPFPAGLPQALMGLPEGDQAPVVGQGLLILRDFQGVPADGVHPIRRAIAVVVEFTVASGLGAKKFLSRLEEGHPLRKKHKGCRQPVLTNQEFPGSVGAYEVQPIEKGVVVVAGDVVHALLRLGGPVGQTPEAGIQSVLVADGPGDEAGGTAVENGTPEQIPAGVGEEGDPWGQGGAVLGGQLRTRPDGAGVHLPALAVENHMGMAAFHRLNDLIDGGSVQ